MADMEAQELIRSNAGQIVIDIEDDAMTEVKENIKVASISKKSDEQPQEAEGSEEIISNQPEF